MRIRTQFIITMFLFGVVLVAMSVSAIITNQRVEKTQQQENIASSIVRGASELSYLSNDYVIYRENQQLDRWQTRFASFSSEVASLHADNPEQQALVRNIQANAQRLKEVFDSVVSAVSILSQNQSGAIAPALLEVSWSRMAVQSQGLISDASRLSQLLHAQMDQLEEANIIAVLALIGIFVAYFLVNYLVIQRRALKSIAGLQAGAAIIGAGNLDFRIEEKTNDEIGDLSRAFNRMTADLKTVTASKTELEREIDERKQAEEALRQQEEKFRIVSDFTYDWEYWRSQDNRFIYISPSCERFTGYSSSEMMQDPALYLRIVHPDDRNRVEAHMRQDPYAESGELEFRIVRRDGQELWISHVCQPVLDAQGKALGRRASNRDITERKKVEAEIAHLASFPELNPNPILELDAAGNVSYANPAVRKLFPELQGQSSRHPFLADWEAFTRTLLGQDKDSLTREIRVGNSWYMQTATRVLDTKDFRLYSRDITERKQAEENLRETRDYLDNLLNHANAPIIVWGPDFKITRFNHAFEQLTGCTAGEVLGKKVDILFPEDSRDESMDHIREAASGERWEVEEIPIQHKDGSVRTVLWNSATLYSTEYTIDGKVAVATIAQGQDITGRKQAEEALRKANEELEERVRKRTEEVSNERQRLYSVLEMLPVYVVLLDKDYHVPFANKFFRERFGESYGKRCFEYLFNRSEPCENCESYKAMQTKAPHHWEWTGPDGRDYDIYDYPFKDIDGSLMVLEMGIDITEQKRAQKALLKAHDELEIKVSERTLELEAANKELEAFSYSVSHDLRAPLRSMEGFSTALIEDYAEKLDDQGKQYLRYIQESSDLMARLIDDLLKLSRVTRSDINYESVNLSELAQNVVAQFEKIEPRRKVKVSIAPDITAYGDRNLLRLALENLLGNAWKFSGKAASPRIEMGTTEHNGRRACFIRDNGVGFDMAYADKLFKPFQRLHKPTDFGGTGIGLATVQRIIRRHGGEVWAESKIGEGATFYFRILGI